MENVIGSSAGLSPRHLGRSTGAVLAGFVTILVTHLGTDAVLHAAGVFPPAGETMSHGLFGLAFTYRFFFSILGAYVTARLAPARPLKHALVLGSIGLVLSLAGLLAALTQGPKFGPLWYPLSLLLVTLPCCLIGAKLAERRR